MKKKNLLPQTIAPVERSTNATSKTQESVMPSWATNGSFLGGFGKPVYDFISPFAGDDAE